jgi:AhpC/TSA family
MGGMRAPIAVGKRQVDVAFVNPSPVVTMAYRGRGFYKRKWPLRALASFPSWERIAFAVSKELGIHSLRDIARRKIPLRIATRSSGDGALPPPLGPKDGASLPPTDLERIKVGQPAPDFTLENMDGNPVSLSDFRGKKSVVLVFYRGQW